MAGAPDPGTPSCELAQGEGREALYLLALSSDEGEARRGGAALGQQMLVKTCPSRVEGKGVPHMSLDTGGLGKP